MREILGIDRLPYMSEKGSPGVSSFMFAVSLVVLAFGLLFLFSYEESLERADNLPKFGENPKNPVDRPVFKIGDEDIPSCTAFAIDANYALTAAHCVNQYDIGERVRIYTKGNKLKDKKAYVVGINRRLDTALIKSDFNNRKIMRIDNYKFMSPFRMKSASFKLCGYPYAQRKQILCTKFNYIGNNAFMLSGRGFAIPGMSGGPLINTDTGKVMGIASSAGRGVINAAPVLGVLSSFNIEPKKD